MGRPSKDGGQDPVVPVRLSRGMLGKIDALAEARDATRSQTIREALARGLKALQRALGAK